MIKIESALLQVEINREAELQSVFDKNKTESAYGREMQSIGKSVPRFCFPLSDVFFRRPIITMGRNTPWTCMAFYAPCRLVS